MEEKNENTEEAPVTCSSHDELSSFIKTETRIKVITEVMLKRLVQKN